MISLLFVDVLLPPFVERSDDIQTVYQTQIYP
jgi:hypothetical protein